MLPENSAFMVRGDDGQEYGPVDLEELRQWVRENRAGIGTAIRLDEPNARWQAWQSFPELVALLAEVQSTDAAPGRSGFSIAPIGKRMLACVADVILSSILASPILYVAATFIAPDWEAQFSHYLFHPEMPLTGPLLIYLELSNSLSYLMLALYMAGFHAAHGQTPAKSILRLRVVDQFGQKPSLWKCFLRGIAFSLSFYLYGIPLAWAFLNPERRAFHDYVAGTYVVEA
jgi:uncharacterized RDD family membrane protein YckC